MCTHIHCVHNWIMFKCVHIFSVYTMKKDKGVHIRIAQTDRAKLKIIGLCHNKSRSEVLREWIIEEHNRLVGLGLPSTGEWVDPDEDF